MQWAPMMAIIWFAIPSDFFYALPLEENMTRTLVLDVPDTLPQPGEKTGMWIKCFEFELVTPLFGGGVTAGVNDPVMLIRGTSIRGHLRFWWRATAGARHGNHRDLFMAEAKLWGDTAHASPVVLEVDILDSGRSKPCGKYEEDKKNGGVKALPTFGQFPKYALFPFKGEAKGPKGERRVVKEPNDCQEATRFRLQIQAPEKFSKEVLDALRAWANFGGLGARTRRGCGALYSEELAFANEGEIARFCGEQPGSVRPWPTLGNRVCVTSQEVNTNQAWSWGVKLLADFRQAINLGRNAGQGNRPGRSRWPEADVLRNQSNLWDSKHNLSNTLDKGKNVDQITDEHMCLPRAQFGMPIVMHFGDRGDPKVDYDKDYSIVPVEKVGTDRMASPVILRPLRYKGRGNCVSMAVWLETPLPEKARFDKLTTGDLPIEDPAASGYTNSPMHRRSPKGSALEAFWKYLQEGQGKFKEIKSP